MQIFQAGFSLDVFAGPIGNLIIGVVAFVVCVYEGWRQMYRAKPVDRLEREGQIPSDMATRIRKKPMKRNNRSHLV